MTDPFSLLDKFARAVKEEIVRVVGSDAVVTYGQLRTDGSSDTINVRWAGLGASSEGDSPPSTSSTLEYHGGFVEIVVQSNFQSEGGMLPLLQKSEAALHTVVKATIEADGVSVRSVQSVNTEVDYHDDSSTADRATGTITAAVLMGR